MAQWSPTAGSPEGPARSSGQQHNFRGVAQVHHRRRTDLGDTTDLPVIDALPSTLPDAQSPGRLAAPRGMVVRRRWRQLRAGAGWSWTGLTIVLICWGIWTISVRGTELLGPVIGLCLVLLTGLLLFVVARLLGRAWFERVLNRERHSAWPSHLTVCVFLTMAGLAFLQQTWWVLESGRWLGDTWQWLTDGWEWLVGLWPL
ncbi:DNA-directed RNA polymerase II [Natronosporangium hydrolyticum]|uniref:DNA-directed RNA polymerase II n=1 Tax=Natronosporangium hydrolyticum TaxID=2811111 RepID=A0A895YJ36_9ACTN|nr:DNA-directed RNA polymerase II [Natronosporangium hydrolyticum]QSB16005.1 DNA-directed RNA polymerase II [Natronosporangium hydrolyticum]